MTINIPQKAEQILHILNEAGYEAYVVGGCVRDSILDRVLGTGISLPLHFRSR